MEKTIWCQGNFVTEFIPFGHDVCILAHSVVIFPGENMDAIVKRASHRDIDFLNATANSKDRNARVQYSRGLVARQFCPDQGQ